MERGGEGSRGGDDALDERRDGRGMGERLDVCLPFSPRSLQFILGMCGSKVLHPPLCCRLFVRY
jgi:hypothetical protein